MFSVLLCSHWNHFSSPALGTLKYQLPLLSETLFFFLFFWGLEYSCLNKMFSCSWTSTYSLDYFSTLAWSFRQWFCNLLCCSTCPHFVCEFSCIAIAIIHSQWISSLLSFFTELLYSVPCLLLFFSIFTSKAIFFSTLLWAHFKLFAVSMVCWQVCWTHVLLSWRFSPAAATLFSLFFLFCFWFFCLFFSFCFLLHSLESFSRLF